MSLGEGATLPIASGLTELLDAIRRFADAPRPDRHPAIIGEELIRLRSGIEALELVFSRDAATFAASDEWETQGSVTPVDWVRHQCKMTRNSAAERVVIGQEVEHLPQSLAAMRDGRIGLGHLGHMARTSRALKGVIDEAPLLERAEEFSVGRFGNVCHHARHAGDPEEHALQESLQVEMREFTLSPGEDGMTYIYGRLDPAGGALLQTALEPLAQRAGADDPRAAIRRRADALLELANHVLDSGAVPQRASQRTHLQVTTSLETLLAMAGAPAAEMEFSLPISSKTIERLACDCSVTRILLGADSIPIDVGRERRVVSAAQRRALNIRDKGCRWPGCDRPASWTQAHHIIPWIRGGPTDVDNSLLLCFWHHYRVHEGGWKIVLMEDGSSAVVPPSHALQSWSRQPAPGPTGT